MEEERTSKLLRELENIDDRPESFRAFVDRHAFSRTSDSLADYLNSFLSGRSDFRVADVIRRSNADKNYSYQIFNGRKEHPDKYKLIPLCIAMEMTVKETDRALFFAGQSKLSPKDTLDAALIVCMNHGYTDMIAVNEFLTENGLSAL